MRKTKVLKIDGREITIKELTVRDVYNLFDEEKSILDKVDSFLARCSDLTRDELLDFAPSEMDVMFDAFSEVNASFLARSKSLGLDKMFSQVIEGIATDLQKPFAQLAGQDTAE